VEPFVPEKPTTHKLEVQPFILNTEQRGQKASKEFKEKVKKQKKRESQQRNFKAQPMPIADQPVRSTPFYSSPLLALVALFHPLLALFSPLFFFTIFSSSFPPLFLLSSFSLPSVLISPPTGALRLRIRRPNHPTTLPTPIRPARRTTRTKIHKTSDGGREREERTRIVQSQSHPRLTTLRSAQVRKALNGNFGLCAEFGHSVGAAPAIRAA
jgi:hypothetical protein